MKEIKKIAINGYCIKKNSKVLLTNKKTGKPKKGEIREADLRKMKNDFIEEADVKPYNGRERLIKKFSVSLNVDEFKRLIKFYDTDDPTKGIDVIKINFSVHLNPAPKECEGFDYSDSLTVVVEAAKFINPDEKSSWVSHIEIGDFVLIPAYPSSDENKWTGKDPCCPSSNP